MPRCTLRRVTPYLLVGVAALTLAGCQRQATNTNVAAPAASPMVKADVLNTIDRAQSEIGFDFTSKLHDGSGRFARMIAEGSFDRRDPTKVAATLTIDAASIETGITVRDTHLKSADFFNVEKYPTVTYNITSAEMDATGKQLTVHGDLTMMETTTSVAAPVSIFDNSDGSVTLRGSATINRRDWGTFKYDETPTINPVDNQVPIHITLTFR